MVKNILLLGNRALREKCEIVNDFNNPGLMDEIRDLKDTLEDFRKKNGTGRGIAANQIGIKKRFIVINLGKGPIVIINPVIKSFSGESFTMWDDCMSFPDILVKIRRFKSVDVEYFDETGKLQIWTNIDQALSELLQHEIDHLDGILAVDRLIDEKGIIYKSEYFKNITYFDNQTDYSIKPTINT